MLSAIARTRPMRSPNHPKTSPPAAAPATWTERAVAAGYYDQAHFIADFRDLVGMTPSRFASNGAARW